jgi:mannose-6-phosphate isomerase class I
MKTQPMTVENANVASREQLIFANRESLPQGKCKLTVTKGHAWVFAPDQNVPLHAGESLEIGNEDGNVTIRSLYTRGFAKFKVERE